MGDNVYTRLLARAVEIEGSIQALAHRAHAPEATLLRWISGRAQMPFKAYEMLLQFVQQAESQAPLAMSKSGPASASTNPERLTFPLGKLLGRCARCDGTEFRRYDANAPLKMTSVLECCACFAQVIHGALLVELGKDAMASGRANAVYRAKRFGPMIARTGAASTDKKVKTGPGG